MVAPPNLYDGTYTGGYEAWCFVRFMLRGLGPVVLYYIHYYVQLDRLFWKASVSIEKFLKRHSTQLIHRCRAGS